ncbi:GNAT family N-acetyltransferase [Streptomyces kebangsaanensis]|uniref:GNAT family N-acetyltransferase n=1 Tax=Streptomyces kebangsaanensis TaxID=864058 RepID=UPI00093F07D8|nr:GNAT family protein [Streptomyces kebangsaanensis]
MVTNLHDSQSFATVRLEGHGLLLRPWDPESDADVAACLRGVTDPEFLRWNTPPVPVTDTAGARDFLRARAARAREGSAASFLIADAESGGGTALGHIGVNDVHRLLGVARVGYWVLPEARGRRVATRALGLAADWAFREVGLHRLELAHVAGHEASCRVAEHRGFRHEGLLRGALFEAGRRDAFRDAHLHARLATDPEPGAP